MNISSLVSNPDDTTSINEKRDDARRAEAKKSVEAAQKMLDVAREKARLLNVSA